MTLDEFKEFHIKFNDVPITGEMLGSYEYEKYIGAIYKNQEFHNHVLKTDLERKGFNYEDYCCLVMANHISNSLDENEKIKNNDHDVIMNKWKDGTFGIPIHDGGLSVVKINFCPWCGENVKKNE
jgi:hypothetical protein